MITLLSFYRWHGRLQQPVMEIYYGQTVDPPLSRRSAKHEGGKRYVLTADQAKLTLAELTILAAEGKLQEYLTQAAKEPPPTPEPEKEIAKSNRLNRILEPIIRVIRESHHAGERMSARERYRELTGDEYTDLHTIEEPPP